LAHGLDIVGISKYVIVYAKSSADNSLLEPFRVS